MDDEFPSLKENNPRDQLLELNSSSSSKANNDDDDVDDNKRRVLAYRITGCCSADDITQKVNAIVYAFHGALGIGDFDIWSDLFEKLGWFVITPTLPGWGLSSPLLKTNNNYGYTLQEYINEDFIQLYQHIQNKYLNNINFPNSKNESTEKLPTYCIGISYGCIHAMAVAMYGSDSSSIKIKVDGLCLFGPHGPFDDPTHNPLEGMALPSKVGLGFMGYTFPTLTRMTASIVQSSVSTPSKASNFISQNLLHQMNDVEKHAFEGSSPKLKSHIVSGKGIHDSISQSIQGYIDIPYVLRSWSYKDLSTIIKNCPRTYICVGSNDVQTPPNSGGKYIYNQLIISDEEKQSSCNHNNNDNKKVKLNIIENGGHMNLIFHFDKYIQLFNEYISN